MTMSVSGLPPHDAELQIQRFVRSVHRQANVSPIEYADSSGAFPAVILLPRVFPLVLDANMIRGELIRMALTGRTVLVNAANSGVFRLFVAQHVVDEVWEHYGTWARRKKVAAAEVRNAWETELLPLLRCVIIPDSWTTVEESSRLATLARPAPHGDPDDVPTATLTLLLGAPLLSRDTKPVEAVYGPDFDKEAHQEWLDALKAGGDLGPLGQYLHLSTNLIVLLGRGAIGGLRAASARWSWPTLILAIAGSGALAALFAPADKRRQIGSALGTALDAGLTFFVGIGAAHRRAEEQFGTLAAPSPSDEQILTDLPPHAAIGRLCLRELAQAPEGRLSAAELHDRLAADYTIPGGTRIVQRELERWFCFEGVGEGEYQVGRAVVVAPANDDQLLDHFVPDLSRSSGGRLPEEM
jgi:predicted nucleic acid-binding protein